jgi:hypothetical protein
MDRWHPSRSALGLLVIGAIGLGACAGSETSREGFEKPGALAPEIVASAPSDPGDDDALDQASEPEAPDPMYRLGTGEPDGRFVLVTPHGEFALEYQIIDGLPITEGDVVLPVPPLVEVKAGTHVGRRWPNAVIPYVIHPDLPDTGRVKNAIAHWKEKTNVRFVPRTNETDYVEFVPSTGCSSMIGRMGGRQTINLTTGEVASNVVAVAIDRSNGNVHYFYRRGFATIGSTTRADSSKPHFKYLIPGGRTPANIIDVAFGTGGRVYAWYSDGTISEGTVTDLAKYAAPAPYALAPGKNPFDVRGIAIDKNNVVHAFYEDGTYSTGTPKELASKSASQPFQVAAGETIANLSHVDVGSDGTFHAFYTDGRTSSGTAANLGSSGTLTKVSFPGHCTTGSTIHEIGHAVGYFHEQTRIDRDDHVTINWNNIALGHSHNFQKYSSATGKDRGEYDFDSIMHYDSYAFSANGQPTIVKKGDGGLITGQRVGLSPGDIAAAFAMYPGPPAIP